MAKTEDREQLAIVVAGDGLAVRVNYTARKLADAQRGAAMLRDAAAVLEQFGKLGGKGKRKRPAGPPPKRDASGRFVTPAKRGRPKKAAKAAAGKSTGKKKGKRGRPPKRGR